MIGSVHFLLTYKCLYECDHCFLHCGPRSKGTFTVANLRKVFADIATEPAIKGVYFEGGEPFLAYALIVEGVRMARKQGLSSGIVTNAYWATSVEDAKLWLRPLRKHGLGDLTVSCDAFHGGEERPRNALAAASALGIQCKTITVEPPADGLRGSTLLKGRAAERLVEGLPLLPFEQFVSCPYENLVNPGRVHVDPFGEVHICQGISIGNCFTTPIAELMASYDPREHPICGPIVEGGPALLAKTYGIEGTYADECHCCYSVRRKLLDRFPEQLKPLTAYGLN